MAHADRTRHRSLCASQGTALGRAGRIYVSADDDGQIWVGGGPVSCVEGAIELGRVSARSSANERSAPTLAWSGFSGAVLLPAPSGW